MRRAIELECLASRSTLRSFPEHAIGPALFRTKERLIRHERAFVRHPRFTVDALNKFSRLRRVVDGLRALLKLSDGSDEVASAV